VEKFHLKLAEMAALGKSLLEKVKKIEKNNASLKEENASLKEENASLKAKVESQEHRAYEESEEDNIQTKKSDRTPECQVF
jgi:regulator of replication initiation timing